MIDIVEETFYISFDEPLLTRKSLLYGIQCGVAAAMRTEAVRSIFKVTFVNSFQYHSYYLSLSSKEGTPRGRVFPFFFGMYILLDGWGE